MSLSLLSLAQLGLGIAALATVIRAAWSDLRTRLIANRLPALLVGLGVPGHVLRATDWAKAAALAGGALVLALVAFAGLFALWRFGKIGGGDVKLLVAATFFVGTDGFPALLAGTAFAGGLLALAYLIVSTRLPLVACQLAAMTSAGGAMAPATIPYGVAIAAGTAFAIVPRLPLLIG